MLSHLGGRTALVESAVEAGGRTYHIAHPAAADALIVEEEFEKDERMPYWAELWPSAVVLARLLSEEDLSGTRAIELGCGVGLSTVAALAGGAGVLATDYYEAALDFVRHNAQTNLGLEPETRLLDWHEPEVRDLLGAFDLVLAADVLYEGRNVPSLVALIPALLSPGGEALIADPRRKHVPAFLEEMQRRGFRVSTEKRLVPSGGREVAVLVHRLRR